MFKKLNKMKIGARLKKSFRQIILIFGILSALVVVIMLYTINNYGTILDNYAYPQGDIAMAMNESAEVRAASRGIVGYDSDSLIESMKEQHEQAVKSFEEYLEKIRPTMITKEGTACMDAIDKAWAEYKEVDAKVIEVGATTDTAKSLQAQQMMTDEAAPKYQALDDALQKLMALNISLGNAKRAQLRTVMIAALTIIIIVIAVSTIYSNSLSVAISKSIEKPLNELKDRFITFAEGDIDSPLPTVESEDEIKELVSGVSAMSPALDCNAEITFFAGDCSRAMISPISSSRLLMLHRVSNWLSPTYTQPSTYAAFSTGLSEVLRNSLISTAGVLPVWANITEVEPSNTFTKSASAFSTRSSALARSVFFTTTSLMSLSKHLRRNDAVCSAFKASMFVM